MPEWMSDSFIRKGFGLNWILGTNLGSTLMVGLFHSMWAGLSQTLPRIPETWSSVRWTDKFSLKGSWKLSCVGKRLLGGRLGRASRDQIKGMPPSYSWPPKGNLQIEIISSRHWALIVIKTGHACCHFCLVWLFVTLWTTTCQAPLSTGFCRREYWTELPFPPLGVLSDPRIEPGSPALQYYRTISFVHLVCLGAADRHWRDNCHWDKDRDLGPMAVVLPLSVCFSKTDKMPKQDGPINSGGWINTLMVGSYGGENP